MFCGAYVCQLAAKEVTLMFEDALNNIRKVAIESKKVAYIQTFKKTSYRHCTTLGFHFFDDRRFSYQRRSISKAKTRQIKIK